MPKPKTVNITLHKIFFFLQIPPARLVGGQSNLAHRFISGPSRVSSISANIISSYCLVTTYQLAKMSQLSTFYFKSATQSLFKTYCDGLTSNHLTMEQTDQTILYHRHVLVREMYPCWWEWMWLWQLFLPTANGTQPLRADVNNSGNIYTM